MDWPVLLVLLLPLVAFASSRWMRSRSDETARRWSIVSNVVTAIAAVILLCFAYEVLTD